MARICYAERKFFYSESGEDKIVSKDQIATLLLQRLGAESIYIFTNSLIVYFAVEFNYSLLQEQTDILKLQQIIRDEIYVFYNDKKLDKIQLVADNKIRFTFSSIQEFDIDYCTL